MHLSSQRIPHLEYPQPQRMLATHSKWKAFGGLWKLKADLNSKPMHLLGLLDSIAPDARADSGMASISIPFGPDRTA